MVTIPFHDAAENALRPRRITRALREHNIRQQTSIKSRNADPERFTQDCITFWPFSDPPCLISLRADWKIVMRPRYRRRLFRGKPRQEIRTNIPTAAVQRIYCSLKGKRLLWLV